MDRLCPDLDLALDPPAKRAYRRKSAVVTTAVILMPTRCEDCWGKAVRCIPCIERELAAIQVRRARRLAAYASSIEKGDVRRYAILDMRDVLPFWPPQYDRYRSLQTAIADARIFHPKCARVFEHSGGRWNITASPPDDPSDQSEPEAIAEPRLPGLRRRNRPLTEPQYLRHADHIEARFAEAAARAEHPIPAGLLAKVIAALRSKNLPAVERLLSAVERDTPAATLLETHVRPLLERIELGDFVISVTTDPYEIQELERRSARILEVPGSGSDHA